jgi:hypothetical protein
MNHSASRQTVSQHQLHTKLKVHSEQPRRAVEMDPQAPLLLFSQVRDGLFTPCNRGRHTVNTCDSCRLCLIKPGYPVPTRVEHFNSYGSARGSGVNIRGDITHITEACGHRGELCDTTQRCQRSVSIDLHCSKANPRVIGGRYTTGGRVTSVVEA